MRPDGSLLREYEIFAVDREIEIAPGLFFPAWTYNGQVPGPTIRATEGDRLGIRFVNQGSHPHSIHFHGWHPPEMDGSLPGQEVEPGGSFLYEFDAEPLGLHLYHCHAVPLKRHIHKGLYGAFIVDPANPRLTVERGERLRFVLRNADGGIPHDLAVPGEAGRREKSAVVRGAGESIDLTVRAPEAAGEYEYLCTLHSRMMRGVLEVR